MSIQEHPIRYNIPEQNSSSSIVINRGHEEYDPFAEDDDDNGNEVEQLKVAKNQKQESVCVKNGNTTHPVISNTNASTNIDRSSLPMNEQQSTRKSKSPVDDYNDSSNHRSKSSSHRNNYSSDRKRAYSSSPNAAMATTVSNNNNNEILTSSDSASSAKIKKSSHYDERKRSFKRHHRRRSASSSSSPHSSPSSSNSHKRTLDTREDKSFTLSHYKAMHRSEKRDDDHPHRMRNYFPNLSSKYSLRRATNSNVSSPVRLASKVFVPEPNLSNQNLESSQNEISVEDRNRIFNRLKTANDINTLTVSSSHANKISTSNPTFSNLNGGSQRTRSNLIQIVTSEAATEFKQTSPLHLSSSQAKSESAKPMHVSSTSVTAESKMATNDSVKSDKTSKINGNKADDMLMEEMLLEEEEEKDPVKSIDLDSVTIPETSTNKTYDRQTSIKTTQSSLPPASSVTSSSTITATIATATTTTMTSVPVPTPSPTKKPYTLYKVAHTNHTTPPLSSRHKKQTNKDLPTTQPDSITRKPSTEDNSRPTSLDERISSLLGAPVSATNTLNKPTNSSSESQNDTRTNTITITSTPSDKSTESPQDIPTLISTMIKKGPDNVSLAKKTVVNDERRSTTSKIYTSEWLASQKPEEASAEDLSTMPPLVALPTLVSSQPSTTSNVKSLPTDRGEAIMLGKLSEAMSKLIQRQTDINPAPTIEAEDAVPISAKHLERIERRKQRHKRQNEIAAIAKEALKPAFKKRDITKDEYKEIMKKVVTKATHANEVDRLRISKMIDAYVQKYRTMRQHNIAKTSNGNPS